MKDITFYDHHHGNVITVKNPKSRKDAWKKIWDKYCPGIWDSTTFENIDNMIESCEITEVEGTVTL